MYVGDVKSLLKGPEKPGYNLLNLLDIRVHYNLKHHTYMVSAYVRHEEEQ